MYYFAYGSNLHLEQMMARCEDAIPITQGIVRDYHLLYRNNTRGAGAATIEPKKGCQVQGAIYEVSENDIKALDRYEGVPWLYYHEWVEVETRDRGTLLALVYIMHSDKYSKSSPNRKYFDTIRQGYDDWALPVSSLEKSVKGIKIAK